MSKPIQITDPVRVTIVQRRWDVVIYIRDSKGKNHEYIATADSGFTLRDRIWFGTSQEYLEYLEDD